MSVFKVIIIPMMVLFVLSCKPRVQEEIVSYERTDNTVIARLESDIRNIIPYASNSSYEGQVLDQIYNYLMSYDPVSEQFVPELLKAIPESKPANSADYIDKYAYEMELLEEAVWEDGSPVTANDYLVTMKVVLNPLVNALRYRATLDGAFFDIVLDPENPKKFTIYFEKEYFNTLETVTNTIPVLPAYILDPENLMDNYLLRDFLDEKKVEEITKSDSQLQTFAERLNDPNFLNDLSNIKGSGPYDLIDWNPGEKINLKRKVDWWGDQVAKSTHSTLIAYPSEIIYKPISNPVTALAALKSEEIDVTYNIQPADFEALKEDSVASSRYQLLGINSLTCYYLSINTDKPKLADPKVRRALAHALDIDEVLEKVYLGYGIRITGPIHPDQDYVNKDLDIIQQNINQAKLLLKEADWDDSNNNGIVDKEIEGELVELSIALTMSQRESTRNTALLFQQHLKEIGIDLVLKPVTGGALFGAWRSKDFELISVGSSITPKWNPNQSWHTEGDNRTGFGDAASDALIDEIIVTIDEDARNELYKKLQAKIYEDQPAIYLFVPHTTVVVHNRFDFEPFKIFPCYQPRYFKLKEEFQ